MPVATSHDAVKEFLTLCSDMYVMEIPVTRGAFLSKVSTIEITYVSTYKVTYEARFSAFCFLAILTVFAGFYSNQTQPVPRPCSPHEGSVRASFRARIPTLRG